MTREIKFRAWDKDGYMYYSDKQGNGEWSIITQGVSCRYCEGRIMQFTGLKDKNGKEIYESDIVTWSDGDYEAPSNPRIAEVRFAPELCFYAFNVDGGHKFGFSNFIYTDTEKHLEVIGNIYENPELLEESK